MNTGTGSGRRAGGGGSAAHRRENSTKRSMRREVFEEEGEEETRGSTVAVEHLLHNVMRAYANLDLSGVNDGQLGVLATALGANHALKSINLSHNTLIGGEGLIALAHGLAANESVTSLNLSGCVGLPDKSAAEMIRILASPTRMPSEGGTTPIQRVPPAKLATLILSSCPRVGDKFATALASTMTHSPLDDDEHDQSADSFNSSRGHVALWASDEQMLQVRALHTARGHVAPLCDLSPPYLPRRHVACPPHHTALDAMWQVLQGARRGRGPRR